MSKPFKLGLVINPFAGIGGALALKGSDGKETREKALAMGAEKKANARTEVALKELLPLQAQIEIYTAAGEMGGAVSKNLGFTHRIVYQPKQEQTEPEDTELAITEILKADVDLILFAGGDGTARNIVNALTKPIPVIGVPAGCKIHSGVYAVTPSSAGKVVSLIINGEIVTLNDADVMDIDEEAFRGGRVRAKRYGEMQVPESLRYVQAVKMGGKESEELVLADIAAHVIESMDDEIYVMGSGSTVAFIMDELGVENTLLGVDVIQDQELLANDVHAEQLLDYVQSNNCKLVITLIGGQGHILGRGNQQLTPDVIRRLGRDNIIIVATKSKLESLNGRPLIVDSGDPDLDAELAGLIPVVTGYHDMVLYSVAAPD